MLQGSEFALRRNASKLLSDLPFAKSQVSANRCISVVNQLARKWLILFRRENNRSY